MQHQIRLITFAIFCYTTISLGHDAFAQQWTKELSAIPGNVTLLPEPAFPVYDLAAKLKSGYVVLGKVAGSAVQIDDKTSIWGDEAFHVIARLDPSGKARYIVKASAQNSNIGPRRRKFQLTSVVAEESGSAWVGGYVERSSFFIGSTNALISSNTRSMFLLRLDSNGRNHTILRADTLAGYSVLRSMTTLPNGNIMLFGEFGPKLSIANHTLMGFGKQNIFRLEMTATGQVIESRVVASSDSCSINKALYTPGGFFISASYRNQLSIRGDTLSTSGTATIIAKIALDGKITHLRHATSRLAARDLFVSGDRVTLLLARDTIQVGLLLLDLDTLQDFSDKVTDIVVRLDTALRIRSVSRMQVDLSSQKPARPERILFGDGSNTSLAASSHGNDGNFGYMGARMALNRDSVYQLNLATIPHLIDSATLPGTPFTVWPSDSVLRVFTPTGIYSRPHTQHLSLSPDSAEYPLEFCGKTLAHYITPQYAGVKFGDSNRFSIYVRYLNEDGWITIDHNSIPNVPLYIWLYQPGHYEYLIGSTHPQASTEVARPIRLINMQPGIGLAAVLRFKCQDTVAVIRPTYTDLPHPRTILWSTGDTTESISVTESGRYSVTVYSGSCSVTDRVDVIYTTKPAQPSLGLRSDSIYTQASALEYIWYRDAVETFRTSEPGIKVPEDGAWSVQIKDTNDCLSDLSEAIQVDVQEQSVQRSNELSLIVAPNPFNDCFTIIGKSGQRYTIVDVRGVTRKAGVFGGEQICPDLEAGVYYLHFPSGEEFKILRR